MPPGISPIRSSEGDFPPQPRFAGSRLRLRQGALVGDDAPVAVGRVPQVAGAQFTHLPDFRTTDRAAHRQGGVRTRARRPSSPAHSGRSLSCKTTFNSVLWTFR